MSISKLARYFWSSFATYVDAYVMAFAGTPPFSGDSTLWSTMLWVNKSVKIARKDTMVTHKNWA